MEINFSLGSHKVIASSGEFCLSTLLRKKVSFKITMKKVLPLLCNDGSIVHLLY